MLSHRADYTFQLYPNWIVCSNIGFTNGVSNTGSLRILVLSDHRLIATSHFVPLPLPGSGAKPLCKSQPTSRSYHRSNVGILGIQLLRPNGNES